MRGFDCKLNCAGSYYSVLNTGLNCLVTIIARHVLLDYEKVIISSATCGYDDFALT